MKTPKELVRDLRTATRYIKCSQCIVECKPGEECVFTASAKLIEELEQVKRERDAAVEQLRGKCFACAKAKRVEIGAGNMYTCEELRIGGYRSACPAWEWRGLQEDQK